MSTEGQFLMYARGGRRGKGVLGVDLNVPPAIENHEPMRGLAVPVAQGGQGNPAMMVAQGGQGHQPGRPTPPAIIDVDEIDDDVVIISPPRAFGEASFNSRRTRRTTLVVDVEAEDGTTWSQPNQRNKRTRASSNQPVINNFGFVLRNALAPPPPPPPPPKVPTFSCPVCLGELVEEVTTKCGHIFCKACIKAVIKTQAKCPTCRKKVTNSNIMRVYLPTAK